MLKRSFRNEREILNRTSHSPLLILQAKISFLKIGKQFFFLSIILYVYVSKEARHKFSGWVSHSWNDSSVEISYKKVRDGYPLRLWRGTTNVEASAEDVLRRILRER